MMSSNGLRADNVSVRYGGVVANDDVSIEVPPGEIVGLIGPNGAGKTTFIDAISGFAPGTGSVTLAGTRLDGLPPHRRRQAGLARTWQAGELFGGLTVRQNVLVADRPAGFRSVLRDLSGRRGESARVTEVLDQLDLGGVADRPAGELSLGTQRLVGVARAMAGNAAVLLLDEPAAGLDSRESRRFGDQLGELAATGYGILLVDHDIELVFQACGTVYVLDFGTIIASGPPAAVRADAGVRRAYLGAEAATDVTA